MDNKTLSNIALEKACGEAYEAAGELRRKAFDLEEEASRLLARSRAHAGNLPGDKADEAVDVVERECNLRMAQAYREVAAALDPEGTAGIRKAQPHDSCLD